MNIQPIPTNNKSNENGLSKLEQPANTSPEILANPTNSTSASESAIKIFSQELHGLSNLMPSQGTTKDIENVKKGIVSESSQEGKLKSEETASNTLETKILTLENPSNFKFSLNDFIPNEMNFQITPMEIYSIDSSSDTEKADMPVDTQEESAANNEESEAASTIKQLKESHSNYTESSVSSARKRKEIREITPEELEKIFESSESEESSESYRLNDELSEIEEVSEGTNSSQMSQVSQHEDSEEEVSSELENSRESYERDESSSCEKYEKKTAPNQIHFWSKEEEKKLLEGYKKFGRHWKQIATEVFSEKKSGKDCSNRFTKLCKDPHYKELIDKIDSQGEKVLSKKKTISNISSTVFPRKLKRWKIAEDTKLFAGYRKYRNLWTKISREFFHEKRSGNQCLQRYRTLTGSKSNNNKIQSKITKKKIKKNK